MRRHLLSLNSSLHRSGYLCSGGEIEQLKGASYNTSFGWADLTQQCTLPTHMNSTLEELFLKSALDANTTITRSATGSSPPADANADSGPSYWWMHGLVSFLFLVMGISAVVRVVRRIAQTRSMEQRQDEGAADIMRDLPQRQRHVVIIFFVLAAYSFARCITEGLIAGDFVDGVGTYEWSSITTIPSALFALVQTCMIARWVQTVEELMFDMHHISSKCGNLSVISSAVFLSVSVLMTLFSIPDTHHHWTGLSKNGWIELLSFMQGMLYTFNGICFLILGLQLASFWSAAMDSAKQAWRRILAIAVVFCFLCVMRGVILCMFSFAIKQDNLHNVMDSNWGAPAVLLTEWFCLTISFFVLAPTLAGTRNDPMPNALPNSTVASYNTVQEETYQGSSSGISMRNRDSTLRGQQHYRQQWNTPGNSGRGLRSETPTSQDALLNKYSRNSI